MSRNYSCATGDARSSWRSRLHDAVVDGGVAAGARGEMGLFKPLKYEREDPATSTADESRLTDDRLAETLPVVDEDDASDASDERG